MHNHSFVRQKCSHMLPSQRKLSISQVIEVDLAEEFGILLLLVGGSLFNTQNKIKELS